MTEHALPINAMIDGDSDRVASALRRLNHMLVQKQLSEETVNRFAAALELLADDMERLMCRCALGLLAEWNLAKAMRAVVTITAQKIRCHIAPSVATAMPWQRLQSISKVMVI